MDNVDCYKTSNNKHFGCPPRMNDGRHFTDYRPSCHINNIIRTGNNVMNSFQYRLFLTRNAEELMDINRGYACQKNCCGPCVKPYGRGTMLPEESEVCCNRSNCQVVGKHKNGLGQGRKYTQSESESEHCEGWPTSLPYNQPYNCCSDKKGLFNYYNDVDTKAQGNFGRYSTPSGGTVMSGGDPQAYNH